MFVVLVERNQRCDPACQPSMSGQRPVLRARQFKPPLDFDEWTVSTPAPRRHRLQGLSVPWRLHHLLGNRVDFMKRLRSAIAAIAQQEDINFLLTNRIPRRLATRFFGWFSQIEHPLVRDLSIGVWRLFADLDLSDARERNFRSLHDCFIRRLRDGVRPIDTDPDLLVSPCDAIVGASGSVEAGQVFQIKGFPYQLRDLLGDRHMPRLYRNGCYVTLRLTSAMYHRFHAPHDCRVESVTYISGDTWNVNPIALKRIERLFCKNERAAIRSDFPAAVMPSHWFQSRPSWWQASGSTFLIPEHELRRDGPERSLWMSRCQGRRNGMVPARFDDHRACAGRLHRVGQCS